MIDPNDTAFAILACGTVLLGACVLEVFIRLAVMAFVGDE